MEATRAHPSLLAFWGIPLALQLSFDFGSLGFEALSSSTIPTPAQAYCPEQTPKYFCFLWKNPGRSVYGCCRAARTSVPVAGTAGKAGTGISGIRSTLELPCVHDGHTRWVLPVHGPLELPVCTPTRADPAWRGATEAARVAQAHGTQSTPEHSLSGCQGPLTHTRPAPCDPPRVCAASTCSHARQYTLTRAPTRGRVAPQKV